MKNRSIKVFLCDLTHDTVILVSDTIPINIGFIGSYLKKHQGESVDISFFKYPELVIEAIKDNPPDVIALSNYSWNSNLAEHVAGVAKKLNPNVITVQGGTNFPHESELQLDYLLSRPNTDLFVELEAEESFTNFISKYLKHEGNKETIFSSPIDGCVYINPESLHSRTPVIVKGNIQKRLKELDEIPSPYLSGMMDIFFDGKLTPFIETNRGCPFTCSFCHTGNKYFNKINMFSIERVVNEIKYIAPKASSLGIVNLHLADTNFGMYARDRELCESLYETYNNFGWPRQIMATTGKNNKERVIDITKIMGNIFSVNMSVQSMDKQVLSNISRDNIKIEDYIAVNDHLNEEGRSTKGELIVGLPGETKDSFVNGVQKVIDAGVSSVTIYSLMMLHGTMFKNPSYRKEYGMKGKYRLVPLNFGEYGGVRIFDVEETCYKTKDMSFEDYLFIRGLSLVIEVINNSRPFASIFKYVKSLDIKPSKFIMEVYNSIDSAPKIVKNILQGFMDETSNELWGSEEELIRFYRKDDNYNKLYTGQVGGNLIYKYKAMSLTQGAKGWAKHIGKVVKNLAKQTKYKMDDQNVLMHQIDTLIEFENSRLNGVLNADANLDTISMESDYNISSWLKTPDNTPLTDFRLKKSVVYDFSYTKEQITSMNDYFKRYGTNKNALSKIVTRVSNVESLFRRVGTSNSSKIEKSFEDEDKFVRYALSS
jgi:radical SAM superfamily enzyme YgiQ (UPF0313 family)